MLVQLALIVFGMFGLLAAIVDMGLVRLTQLQMQVAADSAAIEGLRARDSQPDNAGGIDGFASDCMRRLVARDFVRWTFDDDFDLSHDDRSFGAGPNIKFTPSADDLSANQFMSVPAGNDPDRTLRGRAYKPLLWSNQAGNAYYGDMVSGVFDSGAAPFDGVPGRYEGPNSDGSTGPYVRQDLVPNGAPPLARDSGLARCPADDDDPDNPTVSSTDPWSGAVPSGAGPVSDGAFLVRLRRTRNQGGLDEEQYVSSRGTSLPLLFGRGTLIQHNDAGYDPRRDGIAVRATAIADARPALRIGGDPLATPRTTFTLGAFDMLDIPQAGSVDFGSGDIRFSGHPDPVGHFIVPTTLITVGDPVAGLMAIGVACGMPGSAIRPLTAVAAPFDIDRVAGFARVTIQWLDCNSGSVTLSRLPAPSMASGNATAALDRGLPMMPPAVVTAVLAASQTFATKASAVLAPALVR